MWKRSRRAALAAMLATGFVFVASSSQPAVAAPTTTSFDTPGAFDFVVPAGVTQITVDAFGAQGGSSQSAINGDPPEAGATGGLGGHASAVIDVTPGEVLRIHVGGQGGDGVANTSLDPLSSSATGGAGGANGGGVGGDADVNRDDDTDLAAASAGGGGGGASDVRRGGDALANRIVAAGGGGGAGGDSVGGNTSDSVTQHAGGGGGAGGGASGTDGGDGDGNTAGTGGGGGGEAAGGAGGAQSVGGLPGDGSEGNGGGGGGGGCGEGEFSEHDGGGGGGGGSGLGPAGTAFEAGVRAGDGRVVLTYEAATPAVVTPVSDVVTVQPQFTG